MNQETKPLPPASLPYAVEVTRVHKRAVARNGYIFVVVKCMVGDPKNGVKSYVGRQEVKTVLVDDLRDQVAAALYGMIKEKYRF